MLMSGRRRETTAARSPLRSNPDFRRFWAGQSVSVVGTQVTAVALPLVASLTLHAGVRGVSLVAIATFLPNVVLPLFAGAWLETRRRRRVMIAADAVRAFALATVTVVAAAGALTMALLFAAALIVGSASVFFDIGSFAYVPTVADEAELPAANQAMQASATAAQVLGPGLGGALVQVLRPAGALGFDAVSYLASIVGVASARKPELAPPRPERPSRIVDGLRDVLGNPILRALTAHAALYNAASQVLTVNLIIYAIDNRGAGAGLYGLALSAAGLGAFVGTLAALRFSNKVGYGRAFAGSLALSTGTPLFIALIPAHGSAFALALAGIEVVAGAGLGSANVLSVTLRQVVAPKGGLARTNGGYRLLIFGVIPVGSALGGVVGSTLGSRAGVLVGAAALTGSAFPMVTRKIRRIRRPTDVARG